MVLARGCAAGRADDAHAAVRAAADWTCPANDEDGIAAVFESLIG